MMLPALLGAQGQRHPLIYRGWALGISLDSATALTKAQSGKPLVCAEPDAKTMFCQTDRRPGGYVSVYFGAAPRRMEEVFLQVPLDRHASRDSLEKWFAGRWGPPIQREILQTGTGPVVRSEVTKGVLGTWLTDDLVFGMAGITTPDTTRMLSVSISNRDNDLLLRAGRADPAGKKP